MDFLPDVLDHIGRTPREFGALHVHFERVTSDGFRGVASVLLQGAFHPMPAGGTFVLYASNEERFEIRELGRAAVPALPHGACVRVIIPLTGFSESRVSHALLKVVDAPEPAAKAERVRPAWKLHDVLESPKLSELRPTTIDDFDVDIGQSMISSVMNMGVSVAFSTPSTIDPGSRGGISKVHKAMELPDPLVPVETADVPELTATRVETVWAPGAPLPEPAPIVIAAPPPLNPNARRLCGACGFSGKLADYERDRTCPQCGDYWV